MGRSFKASCETWDTIEVWELCMMFHAFRDEVTLLRRVVKVEESPLFLLIDATSHNFQQSVDMTLNMWYAQLHFPPIHRCAESFIGQQF